MGKGTGILDQDQRSVFTGSISDVGFCKISDRDLCAGHPFSDHLGDFVCVCSVFACLWQKTRTVIFVI